MLVHECSAVPAVYLLAAKKLIVYLNLGFVLVPVQDFVHFPEDGVVDDSRHDVVELGIVESCYPDVFLVSEHPEQLLLVPSVASDIRDAGVIQFLCNIVQLLLVYDRVEDAPDDFCLVLFDDVSSFDDPIAVDDRAVCEKPLAPRIVVSADDFLGKFLGIVLAVAFQNGFEYDFLGIVADVLGRQNDLDPIVGQDLLIYG